jgi:hypothetical protein
MTPTGIFTPWAELLCIPCNNKEAESGHYSSAKTIIDSARFSNPAQGNATCGSCGIAVYCEREDVVLCQRVCDAAVTIGGDDGSAIDLQQTGGMCVAAGYSTDHHELLITESEDHPQGSEAMLLGVYEIDEDGEPGNPIYSATGTVWDAAARARLWEHWMDEYATDGGAA